MPHYFCAAALHSGAHHAFLCGGTPQPHRPTAAHKPGVSGRHRAGQIFCSLRHFCAALPCGCGHDPCAEGAGRYRHQHAGQFFRAAVLLPHGLRRHCHRGVPFRPDRKPDHCRRVRCGGAAAGLYDAQPAHYVHHRQCGGAGIVHSHRRCAQRGGGAAQQKLYAGLPFLCGVLRGAYGAVSAQEQLADRSLQCRAQRPVPVYPL